MEIDNYLSALEDELGEIISVGELNPGVYYIEARRDDAPAEDYYVVLDTAPMAKKIQAYGKKMDGLRLFAYPDNSSGWRIVEYEVSKYKLTVKGIPVPEYMFRDLSLHAMELHPEYFGTFPVPFHTPSGYTLRCRTLDNGIYWLETSTGKEWLAVCFPIWNAELSTAAIICGEVMECDKDTRIEQPTPYRFFPKEVSCIAIYELMETRSEWDGTIICRPALMNAIWKYVPAYAMSLNGQRPPGPSFVLLNFLEDAGLEIMPHSDGKHVAGMFPDAGEDFLLLK